MKNLSKSIKNIRLLSTDGSLNLYGFAMMMSITLASLFAPMFIT